ncbi:MAG: YhbY family RNA-binding protein [Desulfobacteraceae bacterium]
MTIQLTGYQRKFLRGLAHPLKPVVLIGSRGFTQAIASALDEALTTHELVKVKFNDNKEKDFKHKTTAALERATGSVVVGEIGHTAIFYRPHPEPEKRKISLSVQ